MKSFACLNRLAGYGKKRLPDERVRANQNELGARITEWRNKLAVPLEAMADQEERLALSLEKQRRIHARCPIREGRRVVDKESQIQLTSWRVRYLQRLAEIGEGVVAAAGEGLCLSDRRRARSTDGFFRISLEHQLLVSQTLPGEEFDEPGPVPAHDPVAAGRNCQDVRRVKLQRNRKDPKGMHKLEPALERLNEARIPDLDRFVLE